MMKKFLFLMAIILIICHYAKSQSLRIIGEPLEIKDSTITKIVTEFSIYKIDFSKVDFQKEFDLNLQMSNNYLWNIHLIENKLRNNENISYLTTDSSRVNLRDEVRTYKGYLNDKPENTVRLSFFNNSIEGFIKSGETIYRIIPLNRISTGKDLNNIILICKESDLKEELYLGNDIINLFNEEDMILKSINYGNPVRIVRIAAEGDYEFYQGHSSNPNAYIESIINMAEDVYESTFNIVFRIVYLNTYTTSNDPFTQAFTYANRGNVLSELNQHFNSTHSDVYRDVTYLFTGKPTDSISGVAYLSGSYGAVKDLSSIYKTFAHELGHNFNGDHSYAENCGTSNASVMCQGQKKDPMYFSSANISRINSNISNRLITYSFFNGDALCGNTLFSVSNIPSGFTVSWPKSTNLGFNGNSTGSPVTIYPISSGNAWVEPTLSRGGSGNTVKFPIDEFWAGGPGFTPVINGSTYITCDSELFTEDNAKSVTWSVYGPMQIVGQTYGYRCTIEGTGNGYGWVYATAANGCDTITSELFVEVDCGYLLVFTPNPATGETILSIESTSEKKIVDETIDWELEVYDQAQNLKLKNPKAQGKEYRFNTSGWKEGIYVARVKYDDKILTGKLVVKK